MSASIPDRAATTPYPAMTHAGMTAWYREDTRGARSKDLLPAANQLAGFTNPSHLIPGRLAWRESDIKAWVETQAR